VAGDIEMDVGRPVTRRFDAGARAAGFLLDYSSIGSSRCPFRPKEDCLPTHLTRLGRDAPGDAHLACISLFNHIIFGFGIGLWAAVIRQF